MVVSGSAAEVGSQAAAFSPVSESVACAPESEYGKSKLEVTRLCQQESSPPLEIVVARTFNVCGPGLHRDLVLGNIAAQILEIQQGRRERIECGFLGSRRDFVDVRDVARAYVALAQRGSPGEIYNVCSGESQLLRELVTRMLAEAGLDVTICERNEARPGDPLDIYGNRAKIESQTGWSPEIPLPQSLREMLGTEVSA
jgi:GDP-4-dehydro-6-deoxy-D-mannose reductase